jgi:ABC-type nitrate/sulfonate/bicarbonate transport system substrate-binding protein
MTALANPDLTARLLAAIDEAERWANKAIEENRRLESGEYGVGGRQWSAPMRSAWEELGVVRLVSSAAVQQTGTWSTMPVRPA